MSTAATETKKNSSTATFSCLVLDYDLEIPMDIANLDDFRKWAQSEQFPESGRIDFLGNRIEVDMSPEDLFCHGTAKMEISTVLYLHVQQEKLGFVFTDRARISSPAANLSVEPDIIFLSHESRRSDRTRLVPKASGQEGRYVEIEGAVDLVVEIISDSSVTKDTKRLPAAYYQAGVCEFWLVDARSDDLQFQIHHRGESQFEPARPDEDGFQFSQVFQRRYRLERHVQPPDNLWQYDLQEAE